MSGTEEKIAFPEPDEKDITRQSLDRVFSRKRSGFYFLIASPRTQASALARYAGGNVAVYDFGQARDEEQGRHIIQILRLTQREPDRDVYVYQNFQLALWDSGARDGVGDWDIDAIHRLNYSRDQLNHLRKRMVFCMTREADDQLNRHAMDFYDFVQLFLRLEDEPEERPERPAEVRSVDRSVGVDVKVDFSQDEETLLNQAIALGHQADELREAGRFADALFLLKLQLEIRERFLSPNDFDIVSSYRDIGLVYSNMNEFRSAIEWQNKALEILDKGERDEFSLESIFWICRFNGLLYQEIWLSVEYTELLEERLQLRRDELLTATSEEDKKCIQKEIDLDEKKLSYFSWSSCYEKKDVLTKQLECFKKALSVLNESSKKHRKDKVRICSEIGSTYETLNENKLANDYYVMAMNIQKQIHEKSTPEMADVYYGIGYTYSKLNKHSEALKYYQRARRIYEKVHVTQPSYSDIMTTYLHLSDTYAHMGDTTAAHIWRKKAQDVQRERDAETAPPTETEP